MSEEIIIYTDGACIGNPGPGGYGVVLLSGEHRLELSGGYKLTTNNRMEMIAALKGLEALKQESIVNLYSDSQYLVDSMMKGWAKKWQQQHWMRNKKEMAKNPDIWEQLLKMSSFHKVNYLWVRGHSGNKENERCDTLAVQAAKGSQLSIDTGYVNNNCAPSKPY